MQYILQENEYRELEGYKEKYLKLKKEKEPTIYIDVLNYSGTHKHVVVRHSVKLGEDLEAHEESNFFKTLTEVQNLLKNPNTKLQTKNTY